MWVAPSTPPAGPDSSIVTGFSPAASLETIPPLDCMIRKGLSPDP